MVDVRQAANTATNYLVSLYPQQSPANVQLEEVELTEDEKYWLITLSYPVMHNLVPVPVKKEYKIFKVDAATGQVRSMRIRKLD